MIQQFLLDLSEFNILIPIEYNNSSDPIGPIVITNDIGHEIEKKKLQQQMKDQWSMMWSLTLGVQSLTKATI